MVVLHDVTWCYMVLHGGVTWCYMVVLHGVTWCYMVVLHGGVCKARTVFEENPCLAGDEELWHYLFQLCLKINGSSQI